MRRTTGAEGVLQRRLWRLAGRSIASARSQARRASTSTASTRRSTDQSVRLAALNNRVPGAVLALEVIAAAIALGLLALHISILGRGLAPVLTAAALVSLLLLVTFDLDRPTRGLIKIPNTPLLAVRASMALPPAAGGP